MGAGFDEGGCGGLVEVEFEEAGEGDFVVSGKEGGKFAEVDIDDAGLGKIVLGFGFFLSFVYSFNVSIFGDIAIDYFGFIVAIFGDGEVLAGFDEGGKGFEKALIDVMRVKPASGVI